MLKKIIPRVLEDIEHFFRKPLWQMTGVENDPNFTILRCLKPLGSIKLVVSVELPPLPTTTTAGPLGPAHLVEICIGW